MFNSLSFSYEWSILLNWLVNLVSNRNTPLFLQQTMFYEVTSLPTLTLIRADFRQPSIVRRNGPSHARSSSTTQAVLNLD